MNDTSPALLSPRCEQRLARLFVPLIREDDACTVVRLRGQRSISSREKPIAIPTLDRHWDIYEKAKLPTAMACDQRSSRSAISRISASPYSLAVCL